MASIARVESLLEAALPLVMTVGSSLAGLEASLVSGSACRLGVSSFFHAVFFEAERGVSASSEAALAWVCR